jgi:hypothetical protein
VGGTEEDNTDIEPGETSANEVEANTVQVISAPVNVDIDTSGDGDIGIDTSAGEKPGGEKPGEESFATVELTRSKQSQCRQSVQVLLKSTAKTPTVKPAREPLSLLNLY